MIETAPLLRLQRVACCYDAEPVVEDITFDINDRDFTGVVGPSGSGKTTLLRAMLGTVEPVAGVITRRPGVRVGYVPQVETINWSFPVTVAEVVLMARRQRRFVPWATRHERAEIARTLERLGIGALADRHIRDLSGGQQQRVFLARALVSSPHLLIMDEPTSGVDARTRHEIMHLLAELNDCGIAMIISTHDLNGIATHLPRVVCLNRRIIGIGDPRDVLTSEVLERTYGAPMDVLEHAGMPVIVDPPTHRHGHLELEARSLL